MNKTIDRKKLFLNIYDNIRKDKEKYYVPIINSGTDITLEKIFEGTERFFFLENGLYFISETVIDDYKLIFPKNLTYVSINENEFNLILEEICMKQLPTKPIAIVEDEKNYIVEKSRVLVHWIDENIEDKKKNDIHINYIDSEDTIVNKEINIKKSKTFKEKFIIGSVITFLCLLKVLFLYVSYLFSFNILALTGFFAFITLFIVFVFLNTLSDIMIRGFLDCISKPKSQIKK